MADHSSFDYRLAVRRQWKGAAMMDCNCRLPGSIATSGEGAGGLGALLPPVHIGAPFSLGVEVSEFSGGPRAIDIEQIRLALAASDYVLPSVQVYQMGGYFNPFVVVEGSSGREYGSATHLKDAVLSVIQAATAGAATVNFGSVRFEAETYEPSTGGAQTTRFDAPLGGGASGAPQVISSLTQSIASYFGLSADEAKLILIGGAAILALVVLRR